MLEVTGRYFHKLSPRLKEISEGTVYRRQKSSGLVETAKVLEIGRDDLGIPHVLYETTFACRGGTAVRYSERRMLNLETFSVEFCDA